MHGQAKDFLTKEKHRVMLFSLRIVLSFVRPWFGLVCYVAVVITWLILDSRIEKKLRAVE